MLKVPHFNADLGDKIIDVFVKKPKKRKLLLHDYITPEQSEKRVINLEIALSVMLLIACSSLTCLAVIQKLRSEKSVIIVQKSIKSMMVVD